VTADDVRASLLERIHGPIPRWLVWVLIPGVAGPVLILAFIFVSELAHDEARCPYTHTSTKPLNSEVSVREDARSCLPGVQERRFTAVRGAQEHVLGRRRFASTAFAPDHYQWRAELSPQGEVRVTVDNAGHAQAVFREGTPDERAR
jgi:hypothetical protein